MYQEIQETVLDVGCGDEKYEGSLGLDFVRTSDSEILGDGRRLPIQNESLDRLYASHVLEHFSHKEEHEIIREWRRVLKPGGKLEIIVPWLRIRALLFFLQPSQRNVTHIYGAQDRPGQFHKNGFSYGILKRLLKDEGFKDIRLMKDGLMGVPFLPNSWSCFRMV